ncbi:MAG: Gfo/Idh/MocA family protein [Candidatus Hodarchaeota archaeon]
MNKVKAAIVGLGRMSWHQGRAWEANPNGEVSAICDVSEERLKRKANLWKIKKKFTNYDDLLKDPDIDAVDLVLPHALHAEYAIKAAEAGKHILCQKPIAMNVEDAEAVISAVKKAGVKYQIMENYLYYPPHEKAKELIENGEIGKPITIQMMAASGFGGYSKEYYYGLLEEGRDIKVDRWNRGSMFIDDAPHRFATARWFMSPEAGKYNEIDSVFAFIPNISERQENPAVVSWMHTDGRLGSCTWARGECTKDFTLVRERYGRLIEYIIIWGTEGSIWVFNLHSNFLREPPLILYNGKDETRTSFDGLNDNFDYSFQNAVEQFSDCIINDKQPRIGAEDGKKIIQIGFSALKSSIDKKAVKVGAVKNLPW